MKYYAEGSVKDKRHDRAPKYLESKEVSAVRHFDYVTC